MSSDICKGTRSLPETWLYQLYQWEFDKPSAKIIHPLSWQRGPATYEPMKSDIYGSFRIPEDRYVGEYKSVELHAPLPFHMLFILLLFYFHGTIQASPMPNFSRDTAPQDNNPSNQCFCPDQQRTIWNIVWSCISTIFACTWVAVHPNIPPPGERWWQRVVRELDLMIWGIVAPEVIVYWAMKQWIGARKLEAKYQRFGWTKTHGYFVQMGGFTLYKGEEFRGVLLHKRLANLLETGAIEIPKITEEEIEDRSKGDGLSKAFALGQSLWFFIQCIARHFQDLMITELELATMGFVVVNFVIYFLWWKKPLRVQCSVPVYLLDEPTIVLEKVEPVEQCRPPISMMEMIRIRLANFWTSIKIPSASYIWEAIQGSFSIIIFGIMSFVPAIFLLVFGPLLAAPVRLTSVVAPDQKEDQEMVSVTTFYSIHDEAVENLTLLVPTIVASIFGGVHCAGWFFTYPSHAEELIWRICSTFTLVVPWTMIAANFLSQQEDDDLVSRLCLLVSYYLVPPMILCAVLYVVARLLLVGEALAALRFLPLEARAVVEWVEFFPHI